MKSHRLINLALNVVAVFCLAGFASAAWTRLPTAGNMGVNLASNALAGTTVKYSNGIIRPNAMVSDDPGDYFSIPKGASEVVLQMASQSMVESFNFLNREAEGDVKIYGSTDSKSWTPLSGGTYSGTINFDCRFAGMQGKYFKLTFNATKGGELRTFQLSGALTDSDITKTEKKIKTIKGNESLVNYAGNIGTPIYAHPTPINLGDNSAKNPRQTLKFPRTSERFLTIIYDLGALRILKRFSAAYAQKPVRLETFIFEKLPEEKDWRGKLSLNPTLFTTTKPIAIGEDPTGLGHIMIPLKESVTARFVALRFEPNYQRAAAQMPGAGWSEFLASVKVTLQDLGGIPLMGEGRLIQGAGAGLSVSTGIIGAPGEAGSYNAGTSTTTSTTNPDGSITTTTTTTNADGSTTITTSTTTYNADGTITTTSKTTTQNADGTTSTSSSTSTTTPNPDGSSTTTTTTTNPDGSTSSSSSTASSGNEGGNNNTTIGGGPGWVGGGVPGSSGSLPQDNNNNPPPPPNNNNPPPNNNNPPPSNNGGGSIVPPVTACD